jgi:phytoene dehydrogenase-like protein
VSAAPDAVIVGGGHNGLVCACYLAARGLKVTVLERRHVVGGAAVTEEFHPGFRNSTLSYTVSLLHPRIMSDLRLAQHGLRIVERPFSNFLPLGTAAGECIRIGGGLAATQAEVARYSQRDALRLPAYYDMLDRVANVLRELTLATPPNVGGGVGELLQAWKVSRHFKRLDMAGRRDVLDLFTKSAGELLDRWFESDPLKAAFGFDSVVGSFASPYTPGSAYILLHHVFGEVNGKKGIWGHAIGGMGAITQAMAKEASARGVDIRVDAPVAAVRVANGEACGVLLQDGTEIAAKIVVSNLNPKLLFEHLVDPQALPEDFRERIGGYQNGSGSFRMNVALSALPDFTCAPNDASGAAQPHHASGIIMAPTLRYMEQAYFDARTHGWSGDPIVEMLIPSIADASLAPQGRHVASFFCQQFHPDLPSVRAGQTWDDCRDAAAEAVVATVERYAPGFRRCIIAMQIHTPLDMEREFGLIGGDIFHGRLTLDQMFSARPVLGHGNYRTPVRGLYMCGSGTHPGGGVTGIPGHNAAREILKDR